MESLTIQPRDLVEAGLFASEEETIQVALDHLLDDRPDLRIDLAVHLYGTKKQISLGRAGELADVSRWQMMDILISRGVELRIGPATIEEAKQEAVTLERYLRAHPD